MVHPTSPVVLAQQLANTNKGQQTLESNSNIDK